jgi:hypothetical protein
MAYTPTPRQVTLNLQLTIREHDRSPAVGVPARIVTGSALTWQAPEMGERVMTDSNGVCALELIVSLDDRRRKLPSNFFASLMSSPVRTQHLQVAVELEHAGRPWLTAIDIDHFENGTSAQLEPIRIFGRAANGRFTDDVPLLNGSWHARLPKGVVTSVPGFDVSGVSLEPDLTYGDNAHWMMRATLTRWAPTAARE